MVVLTPQSEFGVAPPPTTPYSVVTNVPTWDLAVRIRGGDMSDMVRVKNIYPRFTPMQFARQLAGEISKKLGREGMGALFYLNPAMWPYTLRHITDAHRKEHVMKAEDVEFRCVDVGGHRLYVVLYQMMQSPGIGLSWGNPGLGVSIRGAEVLLKDAEGIREVEFKTAEEPPEPTWTPESPAHAELRERVCSLLHRAARDPEQIKCTPGDVYLYPSGMGAVWYTSNILLEHRPGTALILGVIFHNTHHHLLEESPHGFKHHGVVDEKGLDELEVWLDGEAAAERPVSYAYVEVPGNPTLDTPNMARLKKLSEKHGFVLIVDETVGSSANVDVLAYSDLLLTSLTKSFSGLSDVMAGSVVLNPLSPHYAALSALWPTRHRNEFFSADAEALLANSRGVLDRVPILDRNARAMAEFLAAEAASSEGSPIANVQYPSLLPTRGNFDALLRRGTPELPQPGYGCLLTVNFRSLEAARAFYDNTGFYATPHLGGHVTLNFPYNMLVFGKDPVEREYMTGLGVQEASVRISAGLEDEGDLIDTLKNMLEFAKEAHAKREKNQV